ncbi:hypothetical protein ACFL0Q_02265 [Thermodesulfobacteriota bacterium]
MMEDGIDTLISSLVEHIIARNPMQASFVTNSLGLLDVADRRDLASYIVFSLQNDLDMSALAAAYNLIVRDTLREQLHFMRFKRYRFNSFDEVAASVYFNESYMREYMIGLALTTFLWPNHMAMRHFFIRHLPTDKTGIYLEVGPGNTYLRVSRVIRIGDVPQQGARNLPRKAFCLISDSLAHPTASFKESGRCRGSRYYSPREFAFGKSCSPSPVIGCSILRARHTMCRARECPSCGATWSTRGEKTYVCPQEKHSPRSRGSLTGGIPPSNTYSV